MARLVQRLGVLAIIRDRDGRRIWRIFWIRGLRSRLCMGIGIMVRLPHLPPYLLQTPLQPPSYFDYHLTLHLACNWYGGELLSLAIPHSSSAAFSAAGYTPLIVNSTYIGGQTRQHGNLSFTRVYEAGHEVPAYQPETAYKIFTRALFNQDIATGNVSTASEPDYATSGPDNVFNITNEVCVLVLILLGVPKG
jgi:hypothetical protein